MSDGVQVPLERTVVTRDQFAAAVVGAWPRIFGSEATDPATSALWAQYQVETGGRNCWNYNIGNVKKWPGDGFDWMCLHGVWEGVSPEAADRLIREGVAKSDPSIDHARAVGAGRVSVLYEPPHPATRFRSYPSLDAAIFQHIQVLALGRHAACWPFVLAGDVGGMATALHNSQYYTASRSAYAAGMLRPFGPFLSSDAFEKALAARLESLPKQAPTLDFQAYDRATRPIVDDEDPSEPDPMS